MAAEKKKFDRAGNSRVVQSKSDEIDARFNGFVFDKAPTEKQAAHLPAAPEKS